MYDFFNRKINYLRISVTDRCNLRCTYCMPEEGIQNISHHHILSFEEIVAFTRYAVSRGIDKVRLTGGESLIRKDIDKLVGMLSAIDGIREIGYGKALDKALSNKPVRERSIKLVTFPL